MQGLIPHWLTKQAALSPDVTAIEMKEEKYLTFADLEQESIVFARKLQQKEVENGDHVGILASNSTDFIISLHALSYVGAIAVLLNTRLAAGEWKFQIEDADVSLLLTDDTRYQAAKTLGVSTYTFGQIHAVSGEGNGKALQKQLSLDDPFTIIYTSGTTGKPKGVVHTYGNHWWSAIGSVLNLGLTHNDKWLACLPMFHVGGLSIFIRSVIYGMPVFLMEKFTEEDFHEAIMKHDVTIASVVTTMLKRLLDRYEPFRYPDGFRCMLLGGSGAPRSLLEKARKNEVPVFQSYGLTETSSQIVTLSPSDVLDKIGSSGKPLMPAQLQIQEKNENGVGEIAVKGPMVTGGYYKNPDATTASIKQGWLCTGDLGYVDAEGFLYVVERKSDLIISGGENIYPSEIENALLQMDGIVEAGVVAIEDEEWGQVPAACIVWEAEPLDVSIVEEHLLATIAGFKLPRKFFNMKSLPRTASQKLQRNELKDRIDTIMSQERMQ